LKCKGKWMSQNNQGENNPNWKGGGGEPLTCIICGKSFKGYPSEIDRGKKYCSIECYNKGRPRKLNQDGLKDTLRDLYFKQKNTTTKIATILGCDAKTVTYWMDKFGMPRRTHSEIFKTNNPSKRPEVRRKISEKMKIIKGTKESREESSNRLKNMWKDPTFRENRIKQLKESSTGKNNPNYGNRYNHTEKTKKLIGESSKKLWKNPNYVKKVLSALQKKPSGCEATLINIIEKYGLPFRYVGDGQVVIEGKIPDFVGTNDSRKIIEVFGTPWHDPNHSDKIDVAYNRTEKGRKEFFSQLEYDCLIIWDKELKDEKKTVERIKAFTNRTQRTLQKPPLTPFFT